MANIAAPPTLNLLREILILIRIYIYSNTTILLLILTTFFTVAYSIIFFTSINHGPVTPHRNMISIKQINSTIRLLHTMPLAILLLSSSIFI